MDRKKLNPNIDLEEMVHCNEGSAYEALQLYRSRCNRLKLKQDFLQAIAVAGNGCHLLLQDGYLNAASELSVVLTNLLMESKLDMTLDIRNTINTVDAGFDEFLAKQSYNITTKSTTTDVKSIFRASTTSVTNPRIDFLKQVLKWNLQYSNREFGDPMLHLNYANCLWKTDRSLHRRAVYHFAVGENPQLLWEKIVESYSNTNENFNSFQQHRDRSSSEDSTGNDGNTAIVKIKENNANPTTLTLDQEKENLVILGVLHFLALENLRDANVLYKFYTSTMTIIKENNSANSTGTASKSSKKDKQANRSASDSVTSENVVKNQSTNAALRQFCDYLLLTVTRDAAPLYKQLCTTYGSHLNFDPIVPALLIGPIGYKLFNIPPPNQASAMMSNPLFNMMGNMTGRSNISSIGSSSSTAESQQRYQQQQMMQMIQAMMHGGMSGGTSSGSE